MHSFRFASATVILVASLLSRACAEDSAVLTEAECRAAALAVEKMVSEGKLEKWDAWFRRDLLLDAALKPCPGEESFKDSFRGGAMKSRSIGLVLGDLCAAGDRWALLRVRQVDGSWRAIFRLSGDAGFTYHEFTLARRDGSVCAVDVTMYAQGEPMSRIVRREYMKVQAAATKDRSKLSDWERQYLESIPVLGEINDLMKAGKNEEALKKIEDLPESQRNEKFVFTQRLLASMKLGGQRMTAAIKDWCAAFPDDPSLNLLLIALHLQHSEFDAAIESVHNLDKQLGGDPYLSFYEGRIEGLNGHDAAAKKAYQRAMQADKSLLEPYLELIQMGLQAKDWPEVTRLLLAIEHDAGTRIGDLKNVAPYAEYVESAEYENWLEARRKGSK